MYDFNNDYPLAEAALYTYLKRFQESDRNRLFRLLSEPVSKLMREHPKFLFAYVFSTRPGARIDYQSGKVYFGEGKKDFIYISDKEVGMSFCFFMDWCLLQKEGPEVHLKREFRDLNWAKFELRERIM